MNTLAERLRKTREAAGLTKAELRRLAGLKSPSTITELENGAAKDSPQIPLLAKALDVEALWLQHGKGPKRYAEAEAHIKGTSKVVIDADTIPSLLPIKRADFKLSAGVSGYEIEYSHEDDRPPIFMAKRWFEENQYNPNKLLAIKVSGRSMEPRMYDGDLVIINLDNTKLVDGQAVAANYEGELVIKRMKRDGGQWYLASDNPDKVIYGDKVCQGDCGILGWVVYRQTEHV
jgi:phage repressor protein C with HTH and peptisase S24 domain